MHCGTLSRTAPPVATDDSQNYNQTSPTVSTSSLPLIFSCDVDNTYNYIQVGGITVDGNPIDPAEQVAAQEECMKQITNQAGKVVGKARTTCEIWFRPDFQLNSTSSLFAIYQCYASKPAAANITWARPKQPKDELRTSSQVMSKNSVLMCTGGNSLIDIRTVTINNEAVNTTEFPELDIHKLSTKCYKETIGNSIANSKAAAKCTIEKDSAHDAVLTIHYTCKLPPVVTEVENVFVKVPENETQPTPTPPRNISKENSCLNTRPCLAGGVCKLPLGSLAYKCDCVNGRTGIICELIQRPFEAYLYFTDLMFMGMTLSPNDSHTVSQLNNHQSHIYKWMVKSLEAELKDLFLKVDERTENVAVTNISTGIFIKATFSLYMFPLGHFRLLTFLRSSIIYLVVTSRGLESTQKSQLSLL
ncbi:uncharacterized protein LOC135681165 isoform X2 [Rhopilema esculentum]|uniref:uncharacterized protein LOC135681165 isoform X2 n=1 Tax=Rhopilema esculentum TaxID=499914 RepID=UPI0031D737E9